jgi:hypothetical protein
MATSPNFLWPEPDNSDLVKNGALAIRTAVDAIDSSMADLKGGTTGQVLSKTSNTDMDFTWVAQDDSNAIQNAIVDAKGDLIAATAADTPARLAVGTNGQVLTADSTAATGLAWATPAASAFSGASVYKTSGTQNINNGTWTIVTFNAEYFDTNTYHDNSTNTGRFTIGTTGYYRVDGQVAWSQSSAGIRHHRLRKNDTDDIVYRVAGCDTKSDQEFSYELSYLAYLTSGDYLTFELYQDSGGTLTVSGNPNRTNFTIEKVG